MKSQAITAADRPLVRDLKRRAAARQAELFPVWRYHAVFIDSSFEPVQAEGQYRHYAIIESSSM